jgi:cytochrome c553
LVPNVAKRQCLRPQHHARLHRRLQGLAELRAKLHTIKRISCSAAGLLHNPSSSEQIGACHGEVGYKASAAWLEGQPMVYLRTQLEAFASGARHNDIDEQMRNVACAMTPQEVDAASRYYAEHP